MSAGAVALLGAGAALLAGPALAAAEPWLAADVPAAFAVSQPQASAFRPGALPGLGLYQPVTRWLALGVRGRVGVLADGAAPMGGLADPGPGGLAAVSLAVRVGGDGTWIEVVGGGGVTGDDLVPALEIGAGWSRRVGAVDLGPTLRYLRVEAARGGGLGSAQLMLVGIELRRGHRRSPARATLPVLVAAPARDGDRLVDHAPGCAGDAASCQPAPDRDGDTVVMVLESCRVLAGVIDGGTAGDGCTDGGPITVDADRIILAEHVLFAVNRARVRRSSRPVLRAIAAAWERGDWERIVIEGHTDVRGGAGYNQWLSERRAARTRDALIAEGIPADAVESIGFGATRPRAPSHDANRRVEFVIQPRRLAARSQP
jgi:outer membrane protein OmpA-like peptidoglycan-associated protein